MLQTSDRICYFQPLSQLHTRKHIHTTHPSMLHNYGVNGPRLSAHIYRIGWSNLKTVIQITIEVNHVFLVPSPVYLENFTEICLLWVNLLTDRETDWQIPLHNRLSNSIKNSCLRHSFTSKTQTRSTVLIWCDCTQKLSMHYAQCRTKNQL